MPYKDPQKARESAKRRYIINQEKIKLRAKKWYEEHKDVVKKAHASKSDELKKKNKEWRSVNKEKIKKYKVKTKEKIKIQQKKDRKKAIDKLADWYVVNNIAARTGLSLSTIRQHPDLIENHKQQLQLKRLLKSKKYGK